jgi:aspartyl-tRNA(Asn)/glutamyl-tRNA(Gln) amidotransferase subunit A
MEGIFLARPDPIPSDGIALAVKDLFDSAGLTTTYGSVVFADHVPERSAAAVTALEAAGYADVGKTNLHEFAYGVTSQNAHFGTVPNPIAPGRTAGGSSGGSAAALAAGLADAALGTDSGGSIRIPAACCGVVGFKPTFGLVPLDGVFPLAPTFDHAGPMARTVDGCVRMMQALVPGFELPEAFEPTVAVAWLEHCDPLVRERVQEAAQRLNARAIDFPLVEDLVGPIFMREVADVHRDLFAEHADSYGDNVRGKIERCLAVTDSEYEAATLRREEYRERCEGVIEGFHLLLVPTLAFVAPPLPEEERSLREAMIRFTLPFNALGWPALSLPAGPAEDGLPSSVQIVGRAGDDGLVLAAGLGIAN